MLADIARLHLPTSRICRIVGQHPPLEDLDQHRRRLPLDLYPALVGFTDRKAGRIERILEEGGRGGLPCSRTSPELIRKAQKTEATVWWVSRIGKPAVTP